MTAITAVTYNVFHCAIPETGKINYDFYANQIKKLNAHIVCLQEVHVGGTKYDGKDQPKVLSNKSGMEYHVFGNAMDQQGGGKYGNAILSRYPLSNVVVTKLPKVDFQPRCLVSADVTIDGKKIRVGAVHISQQYDEAIEQINTMKSKVVANPLPWLIGGDYNCTKGSSRGKLLDSFLDYTRTDGIDHVLCRGPWVRVSQVKIEDGNGDHDPVVGKFEIA